MKITITEMGVGTGRRKLEGTMIVFYPTTDTMIVKNRKIRITKDNLFSSNQAATDIANGVKGEVKEQLKIENLIARAVKIDRENDDPGLQS